MELVSRNIFEKAEELRKMNYKEKKKNFPLAECDSILINHNNQTFWFTSREQGEFVMNLNK